MEKKYLKVLRSENSRLLLKEALELDISKEDIVTIFLDDKLYIMFYYGK